MTGGSGAREIMLVQSVAAGRAALIARIAGLSAADRWIATQALPGDIRRALLLDWRGWGHDGQVAPTGDWRVWLIRAGRAFGKTRAGAEWVMQIARDTPDARIALVGATIDEVRRVMIEGESGLLRIGAVDGGMRWRRSAGELTFASGAVAYVFSAEAPEALRGPAHHAAWCDELAKWRYGDAAWDNLMLGLRLGERPRAVVTTTPQPVMLMRRVMALPGLVETRGRTQDNPHLSDAYVAAMEETYGGTRLGRQELDGALIDDVAGALWTRAMIEACRVATAPALSRVVVAVDPCAGDGTGAPSGKGGDACGIVCVAQGNDGFAYVLEDASVGGASPERWARAVADCAARWGADRVVAEKNNGGAMVASVLRAADAVLPLRLVHASQGKVARAEPVAALYEQGKVRHVGMFGCLEDELCGLMLGGGYCGPGRSPDRADALVWGISELMLRRTRAAGVRGL